MLNLAPIDQRDDLATKGYVDDAVGAVKAPYGLIVSSNLSSAGWYRVMNFDNTNAAYQRGATGAEVVFHITRRRISSGEESHEIKMLCTYDAVGFLGELSQSFYGTQKIDKIRYTYDSNGAHVDIHVNDASPAVCVSFEIYCEPDRRSMYTAASLESVADSPTGETVLKEHGFMESTDQNLSFNALGKSWYFRKRRGIVYVMAPNDVTSASAGTNTVGTLPAGWRPELNIFLPCATYISGLCFLSISTGGVVSFYNHAAISSSRNAAFSGSYPVYA